MHVSRYQASCFAHFWQGVESYVLDAWLQFVKQRHVRHLSLHYDGIRVDWQSLQCEASACGPEGPVPGFCEAAAGFVRERTGYTLKIVEKKHKTLLEILTDRSDWADGGEDMPAHLLGAGNCIPLAIACVRRSVPSIAAVLQNNNAVNTRAQKTKLRRYGEAADTCQVHRLAHTSL